MACKTAASTISFRPDTLTHLNTPLSFIPFFQDNPVGIWASIISMLCFGLADSLWKLPTQIFGAAKTILFRNLIVFFLVLANFLLSEKKAYIPADFLFATLGISILSYLGLYSFARATQSGLTSVVVPVSAASALFTLVLHIIVLDHAQVNTMTAIGLVVTILGLLMLKVNWKSGRFSLAVLKDGGYRYALLAALFWGLSFGYSWFAVTFVGPPLFTLIQEFTILVLAAGHTLVIYLIRRNEKPAELFVNPSSPAPSVELPSPQPWSTSIRFTGIYIILAAVFGFVGTKYNTIALDKASINTVTGLVVLAPVISVFFGRYFYGDRLSAQQKWAVFLVIAGVFVISYFRYY